mmetsp:Transcript_21948/g.59980  ORF Transcript_21948/g.59980 Transcript_21948/m.59980 type:complete len:213 (-) Transcript_21948:436-1074(-)
MTAQLLTRAGATLPPSSGEMACPPQPAARTPMQARGPAAAAMAGATAGGCRRGSGPPPRLRLSVLVPLATGVGSTGVGAGVSFATSGTAAAHSFGVSPGFLQESAPEPLLFTLGLFLATLRPSSAGAASSSSSTASSSGARGEAALSSSNGGRSWSSFGAASSKASATSLRTWLSYSGQELGAGSKMEGQASRGKTGAAAKLGPRRSRRASL